MKQTLLSLVATSLFTFTPVLPAHATGTPVAESQQAAETYTIDSKHSYVMWQINHLGFSDQTGKWMVNGTLTLDEKSPENSKVEVTIPVANIVTGVDELNEHLNGSLFFDTQKFPTATFASTKVAKLSDTTATVEGMLTVHGVTKPVTLDVKLNKKGVNPITNKMSVGFSATTTLKRSDFGMSALLPDLGDEVKITIGAEAYKAN